MKYLKIYEEFQARQLDRNEGWERERRINKILQDKAVSITVKSGGILFKEELKELQPEIKILGNNDINTKFYSYQLKFGDDRSGYISIQLDINEGKFILDLYKTNYKLDKDEVSKILRMLDDAKDYMGGVDVSKVEAEIYRFFQSDERRKVINL